MNRRWALAFIVTGAWMVYGLSTQPTIGPAIQLFFGVGK